MADFGYARVPTRDQNHESQTSALLAAGAEAIVTEVASGKSMDRPQLHQLVARLEPGDVLLIWKLDRLGEASQGEEKCPRGPYGGLIPRRKRPHGFEEKRFVEGEEFQSRDAGFAQTRRFEIDDRDIARPSTRVGRRDHGHHECFTTALEGGRGEHKRLPLFHLGGVREGKWNDDNCERLTDHRRRLHATR